MGSGAESGHFRKSIADLELLASLATVSVQARTPVLAGASPMVLGCRSLMESPEPRDWQPDTNLAAAWDMIRGMHVSRYVALVTPRFLLRLPYGKDATETESFAFEEMPTADHDAYLWGSGAVPRPINRRTLCRIRLGFEFRGRWRGAWLAGSHLLRRRGIMHEAVRVLLARMCSKRC